MIMAYDTETSGLPLFHERSADPRQPHLVQLALLICDEDGREIGHKNVIIKPDGCAIPDDVAQIHGITTEMAMAKGIPEADAVKIWMDAQARCDMRVAYNESFDRRIMRIAMLRAGVDRPLIDTIEARPAFCTLSGSRPHLKLPPSEKMAAAGMKMRKTPTQAECIQHFFGEQLDGAHDALVDVRACARVFFHLRTLEPVA